MNRSNYSHEELLERKIQCPIHGCKWQKQRVFYFRYSSPAYMQAYITNQSYFLNLILFDIPTYRIANCEICGDTDLFSGFLFFYYWITTIFKFLDIVANHVHFIHSAFLKHCVTLGQKNVFLNDIRAWILIAGHSSLQLLCNPLVGIIMYY